MDKSKYLEKQEIKNRRILLKMYNKQAFKIKKQLYKAYLNKRSTTYLTNLLGSINKEIDTLDKFFQEYAKRQTKETYLNGVKQADYAFKQITGFSEYATLNLAYNFGNTQREAIKVLARETYEPLHKITKTMARDCREYLKRENFESSEKALKQLHKLVDSKTLRRMGVEGVSDVVVGNKTWQQGMKNIEKAFISQSDFKVPYYNKKGDVVRLVEIKDYAKMVARTTTAHIHREGTKDRILDTFDNEFDLVKIIGHSSFPNSPCIPFEGKILSLEGITKGYMTIDEAKAEGLFHPNCIHDFRCDNECMQIYRELRKK